MAVDPQSGPRDQVVRFARKRGGDRIIAVAWLDAVAAWGVMGDDHD
jgi:hypothetical protein